MIRIDTETNRVINGFQKADLLQRAEMGNTPALTLAGFAVGAGLT